MLGDPARPLLVSPGQSHDAFLRRVRCIPKIDAERERTLTAAAQQGNLTARRELIELNLPLVVAIARRYRGHGLDFEDLVQEGTIGVIRAIGKFDHRQEARLATYAAWWIRESISHALSQLGRPVRLPRSAIARVRSVERLRARLREQLRREPSTEELARAAEISPATLIKLQRAAQAPLRLDLSASDGGLALTELLADPQDVAAERPPDELRPALNRALAQLADPRQRDILTRRYGLGRGRPETVREIGASIGLSGARVSQLESAALAALASLPAARACRSALHG
jgi:RNA polymerase primary sigma factor